MELKAHSHGCPNWGMTARRSLSIVPPITMSSNPGHLMILPFKEVPELKDLDPDERLEMMDLIVLSQSVLQDVFNPDGFNIGINLGRASGAGIPKHLHFHIVPRWNGDSNFLPVIGKTRTLPQALDKTWEILHKRFPND
jgi:ATP adenylyltransferase